MQGERWKPITHLDYLHKANDHRRAGSERHCSAKASLKVDCARKACYSQPRICYNECTSDDLEDWYIRVACGAALRTDSVQEVQ